MNKRERNLAIAAGAAIGALILFVGGDRLILAPARELDAAAVTFREKRDDLRRELRDRVDVRRRVVDLFGRSFDRTESGAQEAMRKHLVRLLERSGLGSLGASLDPYTSVGEKDVFNEVGWRIEHQGPLPHVVNFLYLVQRDPFVHRVERLSVSPVKAGPNVRVRMDYSSPVIEPPSGFSKPEEQLPVAVVAEAVEQTPLDSPERRAYDLIVDRDLFRPYVRRPRPKPTPQRVAHTPTPSNPSAGPPPAAPPPAWQAMRVVGLPSVGGEPDVLVMPPGGGLDRYGVGDHLAGGLIAAVDYRPMPLPENPRLTSESRLILKIGPDFWAVERGQTLGQKRIIGRDDLPPDLKTPTEPEPDGEPAGDKPDTTNDPAS